MRWHAKYPEEWKNTSRISLVSSFLCSIFLGRFAPIDISDVTGMNLYDIKAGGWNETLLKLAAGKEGVEDLRTKLGKVYEDGGAPFGTISPYFVQRYGFPSSCNIVPFTGDNPSTILSLPLRASDAIVSLGTSTTFLMSTPHYLPDPAYHFMNHPTTAGLYRSSHLYYINYLVTRLGVRSTVSIRILHHHTTLRLRIRRRPGDNLLLHPPEPFDRLAVLFKHALAIPISDLFHKRVLVPPLPNQLLKRLCVALALTSPDSLVRGAERARITADVETIDALDATEHVAADARNSRVGGAAADEVDAAGLRRVALGLVLGVLVRGDEGGGAQTQRQHLGFYDSARVGRVEVLGYWVQVFVRGRVLVAPLAGADIGDDFRAREVEAHAHWVGGGGLGEGGCGEGGFVELVPGFCGFELGAVYGVADVFAG